MLSKPMVDLESNGILRDIRNLIVCSSPLTNTLTIQNKTKSCKVEWETRNGGMQITVTNPGDETFRLEDVRTEIDFQTP